MKIRDLLVNIDTFREVSYNDKDFSRTRFVFFCILLLSAVALMIGLLVYKASSRNEISRNIGTDHINGTLSVPYDDFKEILDDEELNNTLYCHAKEGVLWNHFLTPGFYTENYLNLSNLFNVCQSAQPFEEWCKSGVVSAFLATSSNPQTIPAGDLILGKDNLYAAMQLTLLSIYSDAFIQLVASNPDDLLQNGEVEDLSLAFATGFSLVINRNYSLTDDIYKTYYNLSIVDRCSYTEKMGSFDVFSFAFTTTTSFYGVMAIVYNFLYGITKKYQHRKDQSEP